MSKYIPRQGDIVKINFSTLQEGEDNPQKSAVVLSRDEYNDRMGFVIVSPINQTIRSQPYYYTLDGYKTHGQICTHLMHSLDYSEKTNRDIEYVETLSYLDMLQVMQLVDYNFKSKI